MSQPTNPLQPQQQPFPTSGPFAPQASPPAQPQVTPFQQFNQAPQAAPPAPQAAPPGQWTQAPAAQQPSTAPTPFGAPAAPIAKRPRILDLYGRLLLIMPKKIETVPNKLAKVPGEMQDRMTADIVVLDGGPLAYGGAPEKMPPKPHDMVVQVPYLIVGLWMNQVGLVSQCREALANKLSGIPGRQTMVLGRLGVSSEAKPGQNAPYILDPAQPHENALAAQWLAEHPAAQPFTQQG